MFAQFKSAQDGSCTNKSFSFSAAMVWMVGMADTSNPDRGELLFRSLLVFYYFLKDFVELKETIIPCDLDNGE